MTRMKASDNMDYETLKEMDKKELKTYINKKMKENNEEIELTPEQRKTLWDAKTKMMERQIAENKKIINKIKNRILDWWMEEETQIRKSVI